MAVCTSQEYSWPAFSMQGSAFSDGIFWSLLHVRLAAQGDKEWGIRMAGQTAATFRAHCTIALLVILCMAFP